MKGCTPKHIKHMFFRISVLSTVLSPLNFKSKHFYDQVFVSCTTNFSILAISASPSPTLSSRDSQDGPTAAGAAQDKTGF